MTPSPHGIKIRPARPADTEAVVALARELNEHDGTPFHEERHRRAIGELILHSEWGCICLIEEGNALAGYIVLVLGYSLEFGGRNAFVDELFLREPFRGRGIGSTAIAHVSSIAESLGVGALHLEVEHANSRAQVFYRKHGFHDHDRYLMTRWV